MAALVQPGTVSEMAASAREGFSTTFGREPAVVGRAPGRVNLMGEHTDYNDGLCLPVALHHATYAAAALREDGEVRIASRQLGETWVGPLGSVGPGLEAGWASYAAGVVWALAEDGLIVPGLDVYLDSRVPVGAGLSSSAAVECAVAVAVAHLLGAAVDPDLQHRLIRACRRAETEVVGAPTGGMDQTVSMLAITDTALLLDFEDYSVTQVPLPLALEHLRLLVIDTQVSHAHRDGGYGDRRRECEAAARTLGVTSLRQADRAAVEAMPDDLLRRRARHVVTANDRVRASVDRIRDRDWPALGQLLLDAHASLRDDFEVSCRELDMAVTAATASGALGARMTGGGFGGSAVALLADDRLVDVVDGIAAVFAHAGLVAPTYLLAEPGAGAHVVQDVP